MGPYQIHLQQELQKLALFAGDRAISIADIDLIVMPSNERQGWGLMDVLGSSDAQGAIEYTRRLLQQGESVHGLWNILLWMMSSLVPVVSAVQDGMVNPGAIAKQLGVSFGSARALLPLAKRIDRKRLQPLIERITAYDVSLKTGGYRATVDDDRELQILIDRIILACCQA